HRGRGGSDRGSSARRVAAAAAVWSGRGADTLRPLQAAGADVASPLGGNAGPVSAACPLVISDGDRPRSRPDAGPHPAQDAGGRSSDLRDDDAGKSDAFSAWDARHGFNGYGLDGS